MGVLPATGTTISLGRVHNAYGLTPGVTRLGDLGVMVGVSANIHLSATFGGRTTPNTY